MTSTTQTAESGTLALSSPERQSGAPDVPARLVVVSSRSVVALAAASLGVIAAAGLAYAAWEALVWILTASILAVGLNPAVAVLERRGLGRGSASLIVAAVATAGLVLGLLIVIPPLIHDGVALARSMPELVADLAHGHGSLGFLEADYGIVERVRAAANGIAPGDILGSGAPALVVFRSALRTISAIGATGFITFLMLREGPAWLAATRSHLPSSIKPSWDRVTAGISRSIGGYVTGNLLLSVVAGAYATIVLLALGVPYALPLGLIVAVLDLVPAVGATTAAITVGVVALATEGGVPAVIALAALYAYQHVENHILNPLVYARTSQLSPLAVSLSLLIAAEVGGMLGVLAAIPIAGSLKVLANELLLRHHSSRLDSSDPLAALEEERTRSNEMEIPHGNSQ